MSVKLSLSAVISILAYKKGKMSLSSPFLEALISIELIHWTVLNNVISDFINNRSHVAFVMLQFIPSTSNSAKEDKQTITSRLFLELSRLPLV